MVDTQFSGPGRTSQPAHGSSSSSETSSPTTGGHTAAVWAARLGTSGPRLATGLRQGTPRIRRSCAAPSSRPEEITGQGQTPDLGQFVLKDDLGDLHDGPPLNLDVLNDETAGIYEAIVDGTTVGGVPYNLVGEDRIALLAVSVLPEFRGRGVSTELIRRTLDDARAQGKTVINYCPVVHTFIEKNPSYGDLIETNRPRTVAGHHQS